ncbi:hypothetical protein [Streptomyces sp. ISL-12]|nr:hypothetical protein [Streptomyces sp. ISL-12]
MTAAPPSATMDAMDTPGSEWITVAAYENVPGCRSPRAAVRA